MTLPMQLGWSVLPIVADPKRRRPLAGSRDAYARRSPGQVTGAAHEARRKNLPRVRPATRGVAPEEPVALTERHAHRVGPGRLLQHDRKLDLSRRRFEPDQLALG